MTEQKAVSGRQFSLSNFYNGLLVGGTAGFFWIWIVLFLGWLYSKISGENIHSFAVKMAIGGGVVLLILFTLLELGHNHDDVIKREH